MTNWKFVLAICVMSCQQAWAQGLSGYIQDENNQPIPFANVYIQQTQSGTMSDANGKYFITLPIGVYNVIFSSVGYESKSMEIIISEQEMVVKNVWLNSSNHELEEVVISAKRKDPAYEIIQEVIKNKKKHLSKLKSYKSQLYVKATEVVNFDPKKKENKETEDENEDSLFGDMFEEEKSKPQINMIEMDLMLNYQAPDQYKEERTAVKKFGDQNGLFVPAFGQTDFNFYNNLIELPGITDVPIISPLARTAILSYKYKLEKITMNGEQMIYKIKVTPRKSGNSTCRGYLYINDGIWNVDRLELTLDKGSLKFYDRFSVSQKYEQIHDTLWLVNRQQFDYHVKHGGRKNFNGTTVLHYNSIEPNLSYPEDFFGNEISVTKKEAYEKDSSYWNSSRPEPLSKDELEMVHKQDSIEAVTSTVQYKDSIESRYNKVSVGEVLFHDVGIRDHRKQKQVKFSSLMNTTGFEIIGGYRIMPYVSYFKKWKNQQQLWSHANVSLGVQNMDIQGRIGGWFLYDPMKLSWVYVSIGRRFDQINPYDAYLNQLKRSNYFLNDRLTIQHRTELINGLIFEVGFNYSRRQSASDYDSKTIIGDIDIIEDEDPLDFEEYSAFVTRFRLSYTPGQRYMTEPYRKIVLGSKYPTLSVEYEKGWNGLFSSDIDFDRIELEIRQKVTFGVLGNTEYTLKTGKFLNTSDLRLIDQKMFRQSDIILYSNPLSSFQLLDTSLVATQPYFEFHHIHHFNGALINNIPLVKKLRFHVVAGGGLLWVKESNYRYSELFGGIERVFKFGPRRRLRIGVYGAIAQANSLPPVSAMKVSFDLIDTWKRDWSF